MGRSTSGRFGNAIVAGFAGVVAAGFIGARAEAADGTITLTQAPAGTTPLHVGYNMGHYLPGSNTSAWVEYSGVNAFRVWAASTEYEVAHGPGTRRDDLDPWGDGVTDLTGFNARKAALRADPLNPSYIDWAEFNDLFEDNIQSGRNAVKLNYTLGELRDRDIHVIQQTTRSAAAGPITGPTDWAGQWEQWQHYYAMAFHSARHYDVSQWQMYNEPNADANTNQADYVLRLKLASDAIRSATADVNRLYGKQLVADVAAPVTAGGATRVDDWGKAALQQIRTDYQGQAVDYDIFNSYAAQVYNLNGASFGNEVRGIKQRIPLYHAGGADAGRAMPVIFSEFNRYTSNNFADMPVSLDTPSVYTDLGSIYLNASAEGTKALYAFKFSQTMWVPSGSTTEEPQKTGYHYVSDTGTRDVGGATRAAGVYRLFTKGFKGERPQFVANKSTSDSTYDVGASYDAASRNYYVMGVNRNAGQSYDLTFDFGGWGDVAPGSFVSVEEVSAKHHGEVTRLVQVPQDRRLTLSQPSQSVWLLTVPAGAPQQRVVLTASDDARVRNSDGASPEDYSTKNYGGLTRAMVGRTPDSARFDYATYLQFDTSAHEADGVSRAILQLTGRSTTGAGGDPGSILFHVYALTNDAWEESTITWDSAPNLLGAADAELADVGATAFPVGHLSFDATQAEWGVDLTPFLRLHPELFDDGALSLALVREERFAGDVDASLSYVELFTRESGAATAPKLTLFVPEPGATTLFAVASATALLRRRRVR